MPGPQKKYLVSSVSSLKYLLLFELKPSKLGLRIWFSDVFCACHFRCFSMFAVETCWLPPHDLVRSEAAVVPHDWLHAHGELEVQVDAFPSSLAFMEYRREDGKIQAISPQTMAQHWRSKMANDRQSCFSCIYLCVLLHTWIIMCIIISACI